MLNLVTTHNLAAPGHQVGTMAKEHSPRPQGKYSPWHKLISTPGGALNRQHTLVPCISVLGGSAVVDRQEPLALQLHVQGTFHGGLGSAAALKSELLHRILLHLLGLTSFKVAYILQI